MPNLPKRPESYNALHDLAVQILDPVIDYFGMIRLDYGFCSPELAREIPGRIDPKLDQHAACERNRRGKPVCERLGAAVDFIVDDESMLELAQWIVANTPFDRLYYYGDDLPVHVSYGTGAVETGGQDGRWPFREARPEGDSHRHISGSYVSEREQLRFIFLDHFRVRRRIGAVTST